MKKLAKSILMLSMASLAILSSCKKDDGDTSNEEVTDVKVNITASPSSTLLQIGTPLTLTIEATGNPDNKIKKITVTSSQANGALLSKTYSVTTATEVVRDTILVADVTYTYTVIVEGEKGNPATKSYSVNTIPPYGFIDRTPELAPMQLVTQTNTAGDKFMQLTGDLLQYDENTFAANKANIDIACFYGTNSGFKHSLSVPQDTFLQNQVWSSFDFSGTNVTKLSKTNLTTSQFNALANYANDSLMLNYVNEHPVSGWNALRVDNLVAGNVLAYKTASGKIGFIHIVSTDGTNSATGLIKLDIAHQR